MYRGYALAIFIWAVVVSWAWADPVVVEDFETGVGGWEAADSTVPAGQPAALCSIYPVAQPAPREGGRQSALIEFLPGHDAWAAIEREVDGPLWAQNQCSQLSFWVKGDGSPQKLTVELKAFPLDEPRGRDYAQTLTAESSEWQRFSLRFFGFRTNSGEALNNSQLPWVRSLRLTRTGSWQAGCFYIDEIVAEPAPLPFPPSGPAETVVSINFALTQTRLLAQLGARLDKTAAALIDEMDPATQRLGRYLQELGPCVVAVRLSSYFDRERREYELVRLFGHLDWLEAHGARWMLTLSPPATEEDTDAKAELFDIFRETCIGIAGVRYGAPTSHYYELFEEPIASEYFEDMAVAVAAYNELAAAIKQADPGPYAYVGGMGFASAWDDHIEELLKEAETLDFLSYHFFSGHTGALMDTEALESAFVGQALDLPHQASFPEVRSMASRLQPALESIFISDLWLDSTVPYPKGSSPRDYFAAAWLTTVALVAAPTQDKLICHALCGERVGLLDEEVNPSVLYHAAWLLRHWAPRGAVLCHYSNPSPEVLAAGIRTPTANNIIIAYGGDGPCQLQVNARGLTGRHMVRLRKLDPASAELQYADLPMGLEAEVSMEGPGVALVQFIPHHE